MWRLCSTCSVVESSSLSSSLDSTYGGTNITLVCLKVKVSLSEPALIGRSTTQCIGHAAFSMVGHGKHRPTLALCYSKHSGCLQSMLWILALNVSALCCREHDVNPDKSNAACKALLRIAQYKAPTHQASLLRICGKSQTRLHLPDSTHLKKGFLALAAFVSLH